MNILLTNATDIFAGGEDYVLILGKYLARAGHVVHVSANPGHLLLEKCAMASIPTVPLEYEGMSRVFSVGTALRSHIRRLKIDIVHSNANYDRTAAALGAVGTKAFHVAGVHSSHSIQHNITHWLRNRYGIHHFIADATSVRDVLIEEDGISSDKITIVPIGVEPEDASQHAARRQRIRSELGVGPSTVVIGNVARLVPFKGHRVLLDALAVVARETRNILVPIVGDGELHDELTQQVSRLGIERMVKFLGFRDDLDALYPAFDIYCHSSLELAAEAFPLAILRALSAGLPIVCTDVGGIRNMVEDGVSGYLRPPDQPEPLGKALLDVIQLPALRESMGQASRSLFERKFHAATMANTVAKIYETILSRNYHG